MNTIGKNTIAGELLRGFIDRMENLAAQKKQISLDEAAVLAEAKQQGLVPAAIRFVIKKRKMKPSDRAEAEAMEDVYLHAMGMAPEPPLFRGIGLMNVDINAKEAVIEAMKKLVPANGSITVEAGGSPVRLTRDASGNVSVTEVVEKPIQQADKPAGKARPGKPDVPDVDGDGAEQLGRDAFNADVPIISNPFPFGDARRPRWDKGWRDESGSDGMDD
jgi:uncharacterized protein (UPF0335 family)